MQTIWKFCSKVLEEGWKARRTQKSNNVNKFIFWVEGNTITSTQSKKTITSFVFSKWTVHPHLDHGNSTSLADGHAPSRSTEKRAIHSQRWRSKLIWDHQFETHKMSSKLRCELKLYGYHKEFRAMLLSVMSGTLFPFYVITFARQSMWETTSRMLLMLIVLWVLEHGSEYFRTMIEVCVYFSV